MRGHGAQQLELDVREANRLSAHLHRTAGDVDLEPVDRDQLPAGNG